MACTLFRFGSPRGQRIAQKQRPITQRFILFHPFGNGQRQHPHMARQFLLMGLMFDELKVVRLCAEHGVHRIDHGLRIAPRQAVAQRRGSEMFLQIFARHAEQARIGTTEAVDGLPGITDDEHGGLRLHRHRRIEPRAQDLPLQRVGVLKLVQQHMAVAAVKFVLHGLGVFALLQQTAQLPFQIGEIHLLLLRLECLVAPEQGHTAMQHRLVETIGLLLDEGVAHVLQTGLKISQGNGERIGILVFGGLHLARVAGLGKEQRPHFIKACFRCRVCPGTFHLTRFILLRLRSIYGQLARKGKQ